MSQKHLLIGSTGMLGQAIYKTYTTQEKKIIGIARSGADINIDISNDERLLAAISYVNPEIIINTAAIVDIEYCEKNPDRAYLINTRPSAILAEYCSQNGVYLIHISTDHYFSGDKRAKHDENAIVTLLNEYARTKFLAEKLVEIHQKSLIIRTNIVGFRNSKKSQSFIEWIIESLKSEKILTLYDNYFISSIDVRSLSKIIFDLSEKSVTGLLNVGSGDVFSKKEFIISLSTKFGYQNFPMVTSSMEKRMGVMRAESLGLDVSKVEKILKYKMPLLNEVIENLYYEYISKDN